MDAYPLEMIRIGDTSPSWPVAACDPYDYFRGSPMRGLFVVSTNTGLITCVDMRCHSPAFQMQRDLVGAGVATSLLVDPWCTWLATGSSTGLVDLYDFRFMVPPVRSFEHPLAMPVTRLCAHPVSNRHVVASYRGNNELRVLKLDYDDSKRNKLDFIFSTDSTSTSICFNKFISGLVAVSSDRDDYHHHHQEMMNEETLSNGSISSGLVCASSDMKLRYIDLNDPVNGSCVFSSPLLNNNNNTITAISNDLAKMTSFDSSSVFELKVIEGTRKLVERDLDGANLNNSSSSKFSFNSSSLTETKNFPPTSRHHTDAVNDLTMCCSASGRSKSALIITGSRDGCIKIWK